MKKFFPPPEVTWGMILLVSLIFIIFLLPVLPITWQAGGSRILYTIVYFSAIFSIEKRRKSILVLSILAFCMEWLAGLFDLWLMTAVSKSLNVMFFLIIAIILIKQVATAREVNLKVILGSVLGYLLLGLLFSIFVTYIMVQDPGAFNISQAGGQEPVTRLSESIYFTFVSLATLGYGDILPLKPYSRSLAIFITISGQLYIAIIIAMLVGKFAGEGAKAIRDNG
jgi:hypothetical protein